MIRWFLVPWMFPESTLGSSPNARVWFDGQRSVVRCVFFALWHWIDVDWASVWHYICSGVWTRIIYSFYVSFLFFFSSTCDHAAFCPRSSCSNLSLHSAATLHCFLYHRNSSLLTVLLHVNILLSEARSLAHPQTGLGFDDTCQCFETLHLDHASYDEESVVFVRWFYHSLSLKGFIKIYFTEELGTRKVIYSSSFGILELRPEETRQLCIVLVSGTTVPV